MSEAALRQIFAKIDFYQKQTLAYGQFVAGCIHAEGIITEEKLKAAFLIWDIDQDGKISVSDVEQYLGNMFPELATTLFFTTFLGEVREIPEVLVCSCS